MVNYYKPSKIAALPKNYKLCGYTFSCENQDLTDYFSVRYAFNQRAFLAQAEMTSCYEQQITSINSILSTGVEIMERINKESCEFAVSVLMHYGIETVTPDDLVNDNHSFYDDTPNGQRYDAIFNISQYTFSDLVKDNLMPIRRQVEKVQDFERELSFERQMQKRGRAHWQGGGFGFSGAIKGALMAGMMNAGTSVIRGIGDSFADAKDASRVRDLKNMIVSGDMPLANFNYIVKTYVMYLWKITMGYLSASVRQRRNNSPIFKFVSQSVVDDAIKRFSNYEMSYKNGSKTKDEIIKATIEYYAINPFDVNALRVLYLLNPDSRTAIIHNVVPLYCLQYEFAPIARAIDDDYLKQLRECNNVEEIEAVKRRQGILDFLVSADEDQLIDHYINGNKITISTNDDTTDQKNTEGGCYIATAVYGSYDCPEVWTLRRFRDNTLAKSWIGRVAVRIYYATSPSLVRWFGDKEWFKRYFKGKLDKMVQTLQKKGVESTKYDDIEW